VNIKTIYFCFSLLFLISKNPNKKKKEKLKNKKEENKQKKPNQRANTFETSVIFKELR